MSATMARQEGCVQLEQSAICLALNITIMARLCAAIEEIEQLIKKPQTKVQDEKTRGVQNPGYHNVQAAIDRCPAMLHEYQADGCHHRHHAIAVNQQTRWRHKEMGAPLLYQHRQQTADRKPFPPGIPLVPLRDNEITESFRIDNLPPEYESSLTPPPSAHFFNIDTYAQNSQYDKDFNPDLLTEEGTSTG